MSSKKRIAIGIGGWLSILVLKLVVSTVVRGLSGLGDGVSLLAGVSIGSAVLSGIAVYLLLTVNPKGLMVTKLFLSIDASYYSLQLIASIISPSHPSGSMPAWYRPTGYLLGSIIWLAYMFKSERVKNTFFRDSIVVSTEDELVADSQLSSLSALDHDPVSAAIR